MNKVRVGVVGCGYWGPNLIRNYVALPDAEVVIIADKRADRLQHIKSLFPHVEVSQDYQDFFSRDLDAVVIATPPISHYPIARDCLEHKLHTFVEKPITLSSQDAQSLIDLAQDRGLTLMVGHTF